MSRLSDGPETLKRFGEECEKMTIAEYLTTATAEDIQDILQAARKINKNWAKYKDETIIMKLCTMEWSLTTIENITSVFMLRLMRPERLARVTFNLAGTQVPILTLIIREGAFYNGMVDAQLRMVQKLLDGGADPFEKCDIGWSPIGLALCLDRDILAMLYANATMKPPTDAVALKELEEAKEKLRFRDCRHKNKLNGSERNLCLWQ